MRVSVPATFGRLFLGPHIASFMQQHPRVSLDLDLSDAVADLAGERVDVAVRIGVPAQQSGLIVRKLGVHRRYAIACPDYLAAHGIPASPEQLADHECMRFSYRQGPQRWTFAKDGQRLQVDINGRLQANSADVLREAALGGHGIALLAEWLVGEDVRQGRLMRLFEAWEINPLNEEVSIHAAYLPNRRNSRKVQAFLEFLGRCVGNSTGEVM